MKQEMMFEKRGVAGLDIFLSIVAMLFMIGLIVMVFVVAGQQLATSNYLTTTATVTNETLTTVTVAGEDFAVSGYRDVVCTITEVWANQTVVIDTGNYTTTGCNVAWRATGDSDLNNTDWDVSYTYTFEADTEASDTINATTGSLLGVPSWFSTFIILAAMVVLVLLVVIIIRAIKGSGLVGP